jgi:hypothetical protein
MYSIKGKEGICAKSSKYKDNKGTSSMPLPEPPLDKAKHIQK